MQHAKITHASSDSHAQSPEWSPNCLGVPGWSMIEIGARNCALAVWKGMVSYCIYHYLPRYYPLQKEALCAATSTKNYEWFHERRSMNMHEPKWNHWNPSPVASSRIHNKVLKKTQRRITYFLILSSNYQDLPPHVAGTKPLIQSNTAVNSASSSSPAISVHSWQSSEVKCPKTFRMNSSPNTSYIKYCIPLNDLVAWTTMTPARHPEPPKSGESSLAPCCTQSPRQVAVEDLWPPDPGSGWHARLWQNYAHPCLKCHELSWHVMTCYEMSW